MDEILPVLDRYQQDRLGSPRRAALDSIFSALHRFTKGLRRVRGHQRYTTTAKL
jgi:hypothetical protein